MANMRPTNFPAIFIFSLAAFLFCAPLALAQMGPAQVMVAPVERRPIEVTRPLVASVMPVTRTTVAAEQAGVVEERQFDEGQRVETGDLLARVNTDLLQIQLQAAEAAKRTAEAQVQAAKLELENAQREVERQTDLFEKRVAPEKEYRDALTRRDVVAAEIGRWQATVAEKSAEVDRLKTMLRKSVIHSPLSGVVARRHVEIGQWIEQGDAVADVLQLDPLHVEVNVPEDVITRVRVGDSARVEIDALGGKSFTGKIDQIIPLADAASRTFRVKILLPNPQLAIWPGFFARAALVSGSESDMLLVPRDAIVNNQGRTHVVAVRDGKAAIVPIEVGPAQGSSMAVKGELSEGEMVVIRGNESLMPDTPLIVLPTTPPGAEPATQQAPPREPQQTSAR